MKEYILELEISKIEVQKEGDDYLWICNGVVYGRQNKDYKRSQVRIPRVYRGSSLPPSSHWVSAEAFNELINRLNRSSTDETIYSGRLY